MRNRRIQLICKIDNFLESSPATFDYDVEKKQQKRTRCAIAECDDNVGYGVKNCDRKIDIDERVLLKFYTDFHIVDSRTCENKVARICLSERNKIAADVDQISPRYRTAFVERAIVRRAFYNFITASVQTAIISQTCVSQYRKKISKMRQ